MPEIGPERGEQREKAAVCHLLLDAAPEEEAQALAAISRWAYPRRVFAAGSAPARLSNRHIDAIRRLASREVQLRTQLDLRH